MISPQLQVAVDVGCHRHRVAVGDVGGELLEEFDVEHSVVGLADFFARIERLRLKLGWPVAVAMEGYNGWARPLDRQVLLRGWRLYNVNNLKLARYKEIFPAPSKSDAIDTRRMLELFRLRGQLRVARNVLQEVGAVAVENDKLKRLTRRRRQLVGEKGHLLNRLQADLQAVCPGLVAITGEADNLWFLSLLACREDLGKIAGLRKSTLLSLEGVGRKYASVIQAWQKQAVFSPETEWVGPMIVIDAQRVLELKGQIQALDQTIAALVGRSEMARRIDTIPGFGSTCSGERYKLAHLQRTNWERANETRRCLICLASAVERPVSAGWLYFRFWPSRAGQPPRSTDETRMNSLGTAERRAQDTRCASGILERALRARKALWGPA